MEQHPLVTIGLPVFNGAATVAAALETLVQQDYPNLQIIISDNASTDDTLAICQIFAQQDSRIRIIRKAFNEGAVSNFRTVLDATTNPFFMWAAADDYWHPQFISRLLPVLQADASAGVVMCAVERLLPDGSAYDLIRFTGHLDPNGRGSKWLLNRIMSGAKYNLFIYGLFRTPLLQRAMPQFQEVLGGDRLFISQMALACRFAYLDEVLLTRTHQTRHAEAYLQVLGQTGTLRKQLKSFSLMILRSSVIPSWRKLYLPVALMQYLAFGILQKYSLRLNMIKIIAQKLYLPTAWLVATTGLVTISTAAVWRMTYLGLISSGFAVGIILFPGLLLAALLLVRRQIISSQKNIQSTLRLNLQLLEQLKFQISAHSELLNRTLKELRYLSYTLLHPEIGDALAKGNQLSDYVVQRVEKQHKEVEFVRKLEESKIREVYIQELFPGIECQSVPIDMINKLTGHANKTDMLYVMAIAKHMGARKMLEFCTYMGGVHSTLHLSHNAMDRQVFTLNISRESDPRYASYLGVLLKGREEEVRIMQIHSDLREFDMTPYRNQFDFVFVDGGYNYENFDIYTQKAFQFLKEGGIIIWNNYAQLSEDLVLFLQKFTQDKPLFRILSTCLLVYIDGVDVVNHKLGSD